MESKLLVPSPGIQLIHAPKSLTPTCAFASAPALQKWGRPSFTHAYSFALPNRCIPPLLASATSIRSMATRKRVDESHNLTLDNIRSSLIRQEDSIIFSLLERSQYCYNADTYDPVAFSIEGFHGSLVEFMVKETEKLHAQVGRYNSPDEHPFFPDELPAPMLPPLQYPQALSKRIHYGKFVAEAKFRADPDTYAAAIRAQDRNRLMEMLTYARVEDMIKMRVALKARTFGQEVTMDAGGDDAGPVYKIRPSLMADLYGEWIMPLTKEVQVEYLLRRLD